MMEIAYEQKGDIGHSKLKKIIQLPKYLIIIFSKDLAFSKDYAFSPQFLDELVMTLDTERASKQVLPVYCNVDRCDVERQLGQIEEQFIKAGQIDDETIKEWGDKVEGWRGALQEVANMPGFALRHAADGTRIISIIVDLLSGASGQTDSSQSFPYFQGCSNHISLIFKEELNDGMGKTFVDRLFVDLMIAGFHTFLDDQEIERENYNNNYSGRKRIIQQSKICIIFFSRGFASSKRRLDELAMILDCYKTFPHSVVPVYDYDVEQSDVKNQLGSYGESFALYEKEIKDAIDDETKGKLRDNVSRWRNSLREVQKFSGFKL